jgi:Uncharacterized protein encoded in hypervariable junctions of pilus gene clusters
MGHLKYKGYIGSVEYSEDDNCLFGKVLGMNKALISYEGATVDELKADFEEAIDSYLDICEERGVNPSKGFSGTLNIRIPSEVHGQIAMIAEKAGTTVNSVIRNVLEREVNVGYRPNH